MRGIDQRWGVARTLLGLGALARLRRDPAGAMDCYQAALPILREIDSRPDIARCLAGIGRVALDQGQLALARPHLAESLRLSQLTGARIGVARGLEAFAALCFREDPGAREGQARLPVLLTAAAAALREAAGLPAAPAQRTQQYLDAAGGLGQEALTELWEQGLRPVPRRRGDPGAGFRPAGHRGRPRGQPADSPGSGGESNDGFAAASPNAPPPSLTRPLPARCAPAARGPAALADPPRARDHRAHRPGVQQ